MKTTMTTDALIQKVYHAMKLAEGEALGDKNEKISIRVKMIEEDILLTCESQNFSSVIAAVFGDRELYVRPTPGITWPRSLAEYVESTGIMQLLRHVQGRYCEKTHSGAWKFRTTSMI